MEVGHIFTKPDANGVYPDGSLAEGHQGFYGYAKGHDGKPIAGMVVTAFNNGTEWTSTPTTTDANGYFQILVNEPGTYTLWFRKDGYAYNNSNNQPVSSQRWHQVNPDILTQAENWENGRGSREADMRGMVQKLICPYGYAEGSTDQNVQCKDKPIDVHIVP